MTVTTRDIVRERLKSLHDTSGLTWREIAARDEYGGIPPGTLCAIAKGTRLPRCHLVKLGLPLPSARVIPVAGVVPDGTQVIRVDQLVELVDHGA